MIFNWFKIFNATEFESLDLVSKEYTLFLEGIGQRSVLVTKGNYLSLTCEGVFLPVNLNDQNPFSIDDMAVYLDSENDDVYLGFLESEDEG